MRPTPDEELAGIRRILADTVAPAVSDEYAAAQLQNALTALDRFAASWGGARTRLDAENRSLASLMAGVAGKPPPALSDSALVTRLSQIEVDANDGSFDAVNARNQQLRGLLDELIRALDASGDDPAAAAARQKVRAALRENLDRATAPGGT
jgi:hypothetical protein